MCCKDVAADLTFKYSYVDSFSVFGGNNVTYGGPKLPKLKINTEIKNDSKEQNAMDCFFLCNSPH